MISEESKIINEVVLVVLTEKESTALKTFLKTNESYEKFCEKLFEILIGKEKIIDLQDFLDLHRLLEKQAEFKNRTNLVIESLADAAFNGYSSANTKWLEETKNAVYLEQISFLKELKRGVSETERGDLKKRFSILDKLPEFELTEKEIKAAFVIIERKRLKERFNKLGLKPEPSYNERLRGSVSISTLVILTIVSGVILAVSIPKVRNYLKEQLKEIFSQNESGDKEQAWSKTAPQEMAAVDSSDAHSADTLIVPADSTNKGKLSDVVKKPNRSYNLSGSPDQKITLGTYEK